MLKDFESTFSQKDTDWNCLDLFELASNKMCQNEISGIEIMSIHFSFKTLIVE